MRSTKTIHVISCHAEGEVGDVIVGGVAPPPGDTLWEQSRFIARDKGLRDFRAERAARRRVPARQSARAAQEPARADGLHHHGAGRHAADVRLQFHLRRHRPSRQRHPADAGARDAADAGGAGRADRNRRRMPKRQGRADQRSERRVLRRQARRDARAEGLSRAHRRHRLWRRQFRHRRRRGAWALRSGPTKPAILPKSA